MNQKPAFRLEQTLRQASATGIAPALALGVVRSQGKSETWYAGRLDVSEGSKPCGPDTIFDLASLTKPLTTSLAFYQLISNGLAEWSSPIGDFVKVDDKRLANCPVWRLLNHSSGLPAHRRYFEGLGPITRRSGRFDKAKARVHSMVCHTTLDHNPSQSETYSDLGYLLLEQVIDSIGPSLDALWHQLPHHGPNKLHFRASGIRGNEARYAATEDCPWREQKLVGEVHDDNCWTMGGTCGHDGLFGNLESVLEMGRDILRALRGQEHGLNVERDVLLDAVSHRWIHPQGTRVLGWDTPTPGRSSSGRHMTRKAFGHLGFTGTSIWIDPEQDLCIVFLTNRVCPTRENTKIRSLRPLVHDLAYEWMNGCST